MSTAIAGVVRASFCQYVIKKVMDIKYFHCSKKIKANLDLVKEEEMMHLLLWLTYIGIGNKAKFEGSESVR